MSKKATELIIEAMKNSKRLNDKIFKLTESGEDFDTGDDEFEFKKETDEDLYYAVQNVNMRIVGTNLGENTWKIRVISWDKYDFTTFRNSLAFADLANNLGKLYKETIWWNHITHLQNMNIFGNGSKQYGKIF